MDPVPSTRRTSKLIFSPDWANTWVSCIAPRTANRTNEERNNIRHYDSGVDIALETGPSRFRQLDTIYHVDGTIDSYVELHNEVTWEIIGLDSGWFQQVFMSKYRVLRIFSNICDRSVLGDRRNNVLGEAKADAAINGGRTTVLTLYLP